MCLRWTQRQFVVQELFISHPVHACGFLIHRSLQSPRGLGEGTAMARRQGALLRGEGYGHWPRFRVTQGARGLPWGGETCNPNWDFRISKRSFRRRRFPASLPELTLKKCGKLNDYICSAHQTTRSTTLHRLSQVTTEHSTTCKPTLLTATSPAFQVTHILLS